MLEITKTCNINVLNINLVFQYKLLWFVYYKLTLCVQVHSQVLEDIHVCRVGDSAHGGGAALVVDVSDCLCAYVQH